jgi:hypothetical protein
MLEHKDKIPPKLVTKNVSGKLLVKIRYSLCCKLPEIVNPIANGKGAILDITMPALARVIQMTNTMAAMATMQGTK